MRRMVHGNVALQAISAQSRHSRGRKISFTAVSTVLKSCEAPDSCCAFLNQSPSTVHVDFGCGVFPHFGSNSSEVTAMSTNGSTLGGPP
jgi:hypothetical protein